MPIASRSSELRLEIILQRNKCRLYLLGKCKREDCTQYHPPTSELAPCRKFFEGVCRNPRCPRPHITNVRFQSTRIASTVANRTDSGETPTKSLIPPLRQTNRRNHPQDVNPRQRRMTRGREASLSAAVTSPVDVATSVAGDTTHLKATSPRVATSSLAHATTPTARDPTLQT